MKPKVQILTMPLKIISWKICMPFFKYRNPNFLISILYLFFNMYISIDLKNVGYDVCFLFYHWIIFVFLESILNDLFKLL